MTATATRLDQHDPLLAVAQAFAAGAERYDRHGSVPQESLQVAAKAGVQCLTLPRALGGWGAGLAETAAGLGAADPAATLILAMTWIQHAHIALERGWPEGVYREIVRDALTGRGLINADSAPTSCVVPGSTRFTFVPSLSYSSWRKPFFSATTVQPSMGKLMDGNGWSGCAEEDTGGGTVPRTSPTRAAWGIRESIAKRFILRSVIDRR
jgi:hypothetical protein